MYCVCVLDYDQLEDEDLMLIAENMGIDYNAAVCALYCVCMYMCMFYITLCVHDVCVVHCKSSTWQ